MGNGKFVISLDFEIYWGVRDVVTTESYSRQLMGVRQAVPQLLELFSSYRISATFATVGLLFFDSKDEMNEASPTMIPTYADPKLSPYFTMVTEVGQDEKSDPFHFGWDLIKQIKSSGQEIGSHTFCHYYCLEPGQNQAQFKDDINAAIRIAKKRGIVLKSFVFPRNQYNKEYLREIRNVGFTSFRGNEKTFFYNPKLKGIALMLQRPLRLLDSYVNLSGHNVYAQGEMLDEGLINIPASRYLRPYSRRLKWFENLRFKRIKNAMTYAAKSGKVFHLWWHPHNFGVNQKENFEFLERILIHFIHLQKLYSFESLSMELLSEKVNQENEG